MNTFTAQEQAQELADFYQKVADGGEIQAYVRRSSDSKPEWVDSAYGPRPNCLEFRYWRIKPTNKVIDLSVLIESGIDCEFSDSDETGLFISKLSRQSGPSEEYRYYDGEDTSWDECQPRMNHIHAWQGGECPLPEGFMVMPHYRKPLKIRVNVMAADLQWGNWGVDHDIIAFEVLRVADGYVMPWEQDND